MKRLLFAALTLLVACATAPSALPQSVPLSAAIGRDTVHFVVALSKAPVKPDTVRPPPIVLSDTLWCTAGVCATVAPETIPRPVPPADTVRVPTTVFDKVYVLAGTQASSYDSRSKPLIPRTLVEATGAKWSLKVTSPIQWAAGPGSLWQGGTVTGLWNQETTPWVDGYHSYTAMHARVDTATVLGFRVHNYGDGVRFMYNHGFTLRGSWFSDIHDDCMEDDLLRPGLVEDNLFDGCHVVISMRAAKADQDTVTGVGDTLVIRKNLGRLKTFALGSKPELANTHGGFFKVGNVYPAKNLTLIVEGNIFRADTLPGVGTLCLNQHNKVARSSGNVLVWRGQKKTRKVVGTDTTWVLGDTIPYPCALAPGWTITRDTTVWTKAVAAWKARH